MEIDEYKTKTLNIAAFLHTSGLRLTKTVRLDREVFFIFTPKEQAQKLVDDYLAGKATVDPRELFARLNDLRDLIFAGGRNE